MLKELAGSSSGKLLVPHGPPPHRVLFRDLKLGSGPTIKPRQVFKANYVNFAYRTGRVFENLWHKAPLSVNWDIQGVVDGWVPGLKGMRAGGVRELILPSHWAYGNGALVYLVKLVEVGPS